MRFCAKIMPRCCLACFAAQCSNCPVTHAKASVRDGVAHGIPNGIPIGIPNGISNGLISSIVQHFP